jgi:2-methylaconitate cis-trans-isomerase PrpF
MFRRGSKTGKLLPTGNIIDVFEDNVEATCIDASNPCVFIQAKSLGVDGTILPDQIDRHPDLHTRLEMIRRQAAVAMGLCKDYGSVPGSIPKIAIVSSPTTHTLLSKMTIEESDTDLVVRAMSVGQPHRAIPITVSLAVAVAATIKGSTVHDCISSGRANPDGITLSHPTGKVLVNATFDKRGDLANATVFRTARRIMDGVVYWK